MAIYKHTYSRYDGPLTARWPRLFILARYSFSRLLASKLMVLVLAVCLIYPIGCTAFIYLTHNTTFLMLVGMRASAFTAIDGRFFYYFCVVQGMMAYVLTALVGPSLVSPDLANGGLPLYFCRPFTRGEYIVGRLSVMMLILSLITWIPGLLLYAIQASLAGWDWLGDNLWLGGSIVLGLWLWIAVLSLIALALSAWIKWRIAAGALVLGLFFAGAGFGAAINSVMRTTRGSLIDLSQVVHIIWADMFRYDLGTDTPLSQAWVVLGLACIVSLGLLWKRVRAFEVVK